MGKSLGDVGRVFAIGDFWDVDAGDLLGLAGRDRELFLMRLLSSEELDPIGYMEKLGLEWPLELIDAEDGTALRVGLEGARTYERELEKDLERWEQAAATHLAKWNLSTNETSMEEIFAEVLVL